MRILVLGSGGREHALVHALKRDPSVSDLHIAPGSPTMSTEATVHPEFTAITDPAKAAEFARELGADLVVIGPEAPLVVGVADALIGAGIPVFGPTRAAAALEGSKQFAKDVMNAAGVPTATSHQLLPGASDTEIEETLDQYGPNYVVKDDGLAGGKGVVVTTDRAAARAHIDAVHAAGNPVLLEAFLDGPEVSLFCLVDGEIVVPLLPAQDHKRAFDNDEGPNTGGMGAYAPVDWLPESGVERIVKEICEPVAAEMVRRGTPYQGLLYAGLAWGQRGPAVIEFNARFGDPETQAVLSLLASPLGEALNAVATGTLADLAPLEWADGYALDVVYAAEGYPESPKTGVVITGEVLGDPQRVLHAGTKANEAGETVSAGGRVLSVMGYGETLAAAREDAYRTVDAINFPGGFYRRDIAKPAAEGRIRIEG